jgi:hypothetical protein
MLSLEKFKRYMGAIVEHDTRMNNMCGIFDVDFLETLGGPNAALMELLEELMRDESTSWISYWTYELDCGKLYKDGCVTVDGNIVKLETLEDLYTVLVENYERA